MSSSLSPSWGGRKPLLWTALGTLLLASLFLRLWGLGWGLPSKSRSLASYHPDEAFLFQSLENMARTRSLHPKKIALHYGTLHFYLAGALLGTVKLLGGVQIGSREFLMEHLDQVDRMYLIVRGSSVFCGLAFVAGVFLLGRKLYGDRAGVWAAALAACMPVGIAVSHYIKLDALLPVLVLALYERTFRYADHPDPGGAWWCGIAAGLLASTRYNCGILLLVPLAAAWQRRGKIWTGDSSRMAAGALAAFLITTPYALLDFRTFSAGMEHMFTFLSSAPPANQSRESGFLDIFLNLIPFGCGWPVLFLFLGGILLRVRKGWILEDKLLAWGLLLLYLEIAVSTTRYTHYLAPMLPMIAVFAGLGLDALWNSRIKALGRIVGMGVLAFELGYGFAFARLYAAPNPREEAGSWISSHLAPGQSVGVVRVYFWTPGILRQAHPPFPLLKGGDEQSEFAEAVRGIGSWALLPDYWVISELEKRNAANLAGADAGLLEKTLASYGEAARFELEPHLGKIRFWRREVPWDLKTIAPSITIYEKTIK